MAEIHTGRCACEGIAYELTGPLRPVVACHCEQCRRISSHFVAASAVRRENFRLTSDSTLRWYQAVPGFRRGFCSNCGAAIIYEEEGGDRVSIGAGSLDNTAGMEIGAHIYCSEKGDYYTLEDKAEHQSAGEHSIPLP